MKPGFPAARNFPFQLDATGSQTSIPICESLDGAEKAITRQAGAEILVGGALIKPVCAGNSHPGSSAFADAIVTFGMLRDINDSQGCCAAADAATSSITASIDNGRCLNLK
jgi:hypothetical protein